MGPMKDPMEVAMDCSEKIRPSLLPPLKRMNRVAMAGKVIPLDMPSTKSTAARGMSGKAASVKKQIDMSRTPAVKRSLGE
ncbi:hypothetical protein D3C76_1483660 [compost metagenome]